MKLLGIDEKWAVSFDEDNNDRPTAWYRHGEYHSDFEAPNAETAMFYALLQAQTTINRFLPQSAQTIVEMPTGKPKKNTLKGSPNTAEFENQYPRMWDVGDVVTQRDGRRVLIVEMANVDNPYESVGAIHLEHGDGLEPATLKMVHRYNRRDYGRVTATDGTDPRDFIVEDGRPDVATISTS